MQDFHLNGYELLTSDLRRDLSSVRKTSQDCESSQVVQFVGKEMTYNDATELLATRAILRTSLTLASGDRVLAESQQVDSMIKKHGLVHVGWLRMGPREQPLSLSDILIQQVLYCR
jgi:hypothetical protein